MLQLHALPAQENDSVILLTSTAIFPHRPRFHSRKDILSVRSGHITSQGFCILPPAWQMKNGPYCSPVVISSDSCDWNLKCHRVQLRWRPKRRFRLQMPNKTQRKHHSSVCALSMSLSFYLCGPSSRLWMARRALSYKNGTEPAVDHVVTETSLRNLMWHECEKL